MALGERVGYSTYRSRQIHVPILEHLFDERYRLTTPVVPDELVDVRDLPGRVEARHSGLHAGGADSKFVAPIRYLHRD